MIQRNFIWVLVFLLLAAGPLSAQETDPIDARIQSMSLEHRIAQMFLVTLHGQVMTEVGAAFLREWQPGGVVLFAANITSPEGVTRLTNSFQQTITEAGGPPMLISIDQEGGIVARLTEDKGFTVFPAPVLITAAGGVMAFRVGAAVAQELSAVGINMNLAPVADLETNRDNPIIFRRSFGNDPHVAGAAVAQFVRGTQSRGVLATAKHFPGHGETREDSHGELPRLDLSRERLETVELVPFQQAIDAGVAAVMVAHIWYPQIDPTPNMPASLSWPVMTGLLRQQMGYDGLIVTDALDMNAVDMTYNFYDAVVMSVQGGADLLAMGPSVDIAVARQAMQRLVDEVRAGAIDEQRINDSVRRILQTKARFGILDWTPLDPTSAHERVDAEGHARLIEDLFRAGVTVAYDRNNHLPITPDRNVAIIFLGTRYQIYHECGLYANPANTRWLSVAMSPDSEQIAWAVEAANRAETAIVFTEEAIRNRDQQALVNALPQEKTIAVALWSAYDWQTYPNVAGFVAAYSPLRAAVPAICEILFGQIPARGQLALTLSDQLVAGSRAP
ncbi:MAG: glycoside hydrolase family 3 N-terminal domain-containing protein [Aggregatilineales bacterium]